MYFGKKLKMHFRNLEKIDVGCINYIKTIILKDRITGYGEVCKYSGENKLINNINEIQNIEKGFQFVLTSDSEDNLNKLYETIKKEFNELDFEYTLEEVLIIAELYFENVMGVHEDFLNEIVQKKREKGFAKIGYSIYHLEGRGKYVASTDIFFRCELEDANIILNEIVDDLVDENLEITVKFI